MCWRFLRSVVGVRFALGAKAHLRRKVRAEDGGTRICGPRVLFVADRNLKDEPRGLKESTGFLARAERA
jgi:hypothetical protein